MVNRYFSDYILTIKPPARNAKPPSTFGFDSTHVLGSQRVAKHRAKKQERERKRKMRNSILKETETGAAAAEALSVGSDSAEVQEPKNDSKKSKS